MNLLFRIVYAAHANGTHHKLALDALRHLENPDAQRWQRLFLSHSEIYLEGSKAPDKEFKDFKNHVLHVGDSFWGGAPEKVESWYNKFVEALKAQSWHEAVYAAGIMSHYYTDPIHPFHTAQSKAENNIHRAVEWSINKSYGALFGLAQLKPIPEIEVGRDATWIKDHVIAGAEKSNAHYETLIAHYNFDRGVVEPPEGLDDVCKDLVSDLIAYAAVGHAKLLDRAFEEAGVTPPDVSLTAQAFVASLKTPLKWVTRKLDDAADRKQVEAMFDELAATGTVEENLPADDRQVRELHNREVVSKRNTRRREQRDKRRGQSPLPQGQIPKLASAQPSAVKWPSNDRPAVVAASSVASISGSTDSQSAAPPADQVTGQSTEQATSDENYEGPAGKQLARLRDRVRGGGVPQPAPVRVAPSTTDKSHAPRLYLAPTDDIEAAPSIGPKTAARFETIGISTVAGFLEADPVETADELKTRHITAKTIVEWQHQARLVCTLPGIRGGHAQLLVGAGLTSVEAIAETDPGEAMAAILKFAQTSAGQSVLRDGQPPDLEKIHAWVQNARDARQAA
ncbi:MAG: hypothetical protein ACI89J_001399 [Hyphomicrobiaceae bacterium]|jgi:hypothetical protein